jgi:hypothetical protein
MGLAMNYDTKIGVVVRKDLPTWKQLNLTAFIAGGLAGAFPEIVGEPYRDGDGLLYTPLVRQPVLIYGADLEALRRARQRAVDRQVRVAVYTEALFQTSNDADNRAAVARVAGSDLDLVGLGIYAERRVFDKIVDRLQLLS